MAGARHAALAVLLLGLLAACGQPSSGPNPPPPPPARNLAPTAVFSASSLSGPVPLTIDVDASASFDPDGSLVAYRWTVSGDGTASGSGVTEQVIFPDAGRYTITLTVEDDDGATASSSMQVQVEATGATNVSPTARFTASPLRGDAPLTTEVDASDSSDDDGSIVSYDWQVSGDGSASDTGVKAEFTFPDPGSYVITLTVEDDDGAVATATQLVQVDEPTGTEPPNEAPTARFDLRPSSGTAPLDVNVDAGDSSDTDGNLVRYAWTVTGPEQRTAQGEQASFTLSLAGTYTVRLRVTDDDGATDQVSKTVKVTAPEPDGFQIDLDFVNPGSFTSVERAAFQHAAERWSEVITGDLADAVVPAMPADYCFAGEPSFPQTPVDDLVIRVMLQSIDGAFNAVAMGSPCRLRTSGPDAGLPMYGLMVFDSADIGRMANDGTLADLVLHEMGHVLGIGTLWQPQDLLRWQPEGDPCEVAVFTTAPHYRGSGGKSGYANAGGSGDVPVEDTGSAGTRCVHWSEGWMDAELMTGYLESASESMPLSRVTAGSLADMGYGVALSAADAYSLPACRPNCSEVQGMGLKQAIHEILIGPSQEDLEQLARFRSAH